MTEKTTQASPKGRFPTPYVMIWAILASISLVYLVLLALQPTLVARYLGSHPATVASASFTEALETTAGDIRSIKDSVSRVQLQLGDLKAEVSGQASRERDLTDRITVLETGASDPAKVALLNAAPAGPQGAAEKANEKAAGRLSGKDDKAEARAETQAPPVIIPGTSIAVGPAKPAKSAAIKPASPAPQAALETGSVAGPNEPVSFGPVIVKPAKGTETAAVTPAAKPLGLQIATGPSVDALRLSWSLLSDRHPDNLKTLEPRYVTGANASGLTYDLVVGPIASATEAKRICKELGQNGTQCKVGNFAGEAL